jgi:hypothetical protein
MAVTTICIMALGIFLAATKQGRLRNTSLAFVIFAGLYALVVWSNLFEPLKYSLPTTRIVVAAWRSLGIEKPSEIPDIPSVNAQHPEPTPSATPADINGFTDLLTETFVGVEQFSSNPSIIDPSMEIHELFYSQVLAFFVTAQCLWTLAFGVLGALLGRYLE